MREIIKDEQAKSNGNELAFETFVEKVSFETQIKTSLESVEDLFPDNLKHLKTSINASQKSGQAVSNPITGEADVDESRVLSFVEDDYTNGSDDEPAHDTALYQEKEGSHFGEQLRDSKTDGTTEVVREDISGADHYRNSLALTPSQEAQGPTSSTEFEALGIRLAGDYSHVEEDAFEIPLEYASDTYPGIKRHQRDKSPLLASEPPPKRLKLLNSELSVNPRDLRNHSRSRDVYNSLADPNVQMSVIQAGGSSGVHSLREDDRTLQPEIYEREYITLKTCSEGCASNGIHRKRTLPSFPILKDPHDSGTNLRLSQRSDSPTKGSQKSNIKSITFDISSETISKVSGVPDLPSFKQTLSPIVPSSQVIHISSQLHDKFNLSMTKPMMCFAQGPPAVSDIVLEMRQGWTPSIIYQDAYYSDEKDVPERAREYAGKEFKIGSSTVSYLPDFDSTGTSLACRGEQTSAVADKFADQKMYRKRRRACDYRIWEIDEPPPMRSEVQSWIEQRSGFDSGPPGLSSLKLMVQLKNTDMASNTRRSRNLLAFSTKLSI